MNANAKVLKAIPRNDGQVELTLKWGVHRNPKVIVPVPPEGIYRKGESVIYDQHQQSVRRPAITDAA